MLLILKIQLNGFGDLQKIGADTAAIRAKFCHVKIRPEVGQIWSNSIQPRAKREEAPGQASGAPEGEEGLQARLDRGPPIGKKGRCASLPPTKRCGKWRCILLRAPSGHSKPPLLKWFPAAPTLYWSVLKPLIWITTSSAFPNLSTSRLLSRHTTSSP